MSSEVQPATQQADTTGKGWLEIVAVVLLLVGGFLIVVGWFIGFALLWASSRWTWPEKLLGTLVLPGGLLLPLLTWSTPVDGPTMSYPIPGLPAFGILLVAPFAVAAFLLHRAAARPPGGGRTAAATLKPIQKAALLAVFVPVLVVDLGLILVVLSAGWTFSFNAG